jgi:hypothetical protein
MAGFWLSSIAWTIPAAKLVLIAALALRHGQPVGASDLLLAVLPEAGLAAAVTLLGRAADDRRVAKAALIAVAALLAVAVWLAIATWAFAGAPVGVVLFARLALDEAIVRTALGDSALRRELFGWLGAGLLLWGATALAVALGRRALARLAPLAVNGALAGCVLAAVASAALGPVAPARRLALATALGGGAPAIDGGALDPEAVAELAAPPRGVGASPRREIRNVLILVLESVRREPGSRFVEGFPDAVRFERAYAHHPRSVKTLEAVLFGIYPSPALFSAAWAIDRYDVAAIALPRVLAEHGFESHYFSAMPLGFDNYGGALAAAGFDSVDVVAGEEPLTWGAAAPALFGEVAATLERGAARGVPQLVMAWTAECHLPYDHRGEGEPEGEPRERYRRCQDALAGDVAALLERLAAGGILDETFVAVLGDHGQIFASEKPGEWGHGSHVHEPSLRIPLLLFAPGEEGRTDARLFQPVDVSATILAALGIAIPEAWVGRDMLDEGAPGREFVVALSALSDGRAAVVDRSGGKLVRPGAGAALVGFDLARDPDEEAGEAPGPVARRSGEARIASYERLAAVGWERRRREDAGPSSFDGRAIAARWSPGPCVATRVTEAGDLRVEPLETARCAASSDPFERRLLRAFDGRELAAGSTVRVTLAVDEGAGAVPREPRLLAKLWGRGETFSVALDPHAAGFQAVTFALPATPPDASPDTAIALVGVDPPLPYVVRSIAVEPAKPAR